MASKIAAGEVIERPASVVKELIENAIDAASTDIRVEVRGGGLQLIRVLDDGVGIAPDELALCFGRHATSKIQQAEDLYAIRTLGFRGEALPSIAAVARVSIVSRRPSDGTGAFVEIQDSKLIGHGPRGCAPGTVISVQDLFANVPARLKYLRSAGTEMAHISHLVTQFALAYPELRFTLINDGRLVFQSAGDGNLLSVLIKVYGVTTADEMLSISLDGGSTDGRVGSDYRVDGYVSRPNATRSSRSYLSFFVNRRWVQNRSLAYAVEEAYHPLLPAGRHPIAVLNVSLPLEEVDVNVHPQKAEVRFLRDREVFGLVQRAVRRTISENFSMSSIMSSPGHALPEVQRRVEVVNYRPTADWRASGLSAYDDRSLPIFGVPNRFQALPGRARSAEMDVGKERASSEGEPPSLPEPGLPLLRVIGQMGNTFIIAEGPGGMYLVDQHRAHERIIFERLEEELANKTYSSQTLLEPLTVELTVQQAEVLRRRLANLARVGFELEEFGEQAYLVRAVPAVVAGSNVSQSVREIIEKAAEEYANGDWQRELTAKLACTGAIKAGQVLSLAEMRELLTQLESTKLPPRCPHGSPTMVHLSQSQLEKQFGR